MDALAFLFHYRSKGTPRSELTFGQKFGDPISKKSTSSDNSLLQEQHRNKHRKESALDHLASRHKPRLSKSILPILDYSSDQSFLSNPCTFDCTTNPESLVKTRRTQTAALKIKPRHVEIRIPYLISSPQSPQHSPVRVTAYTKQFPEPPSETFVHACMINMPKSITERAAHFEELAAGKNGRLLPNAETSMTSSTSSLQSPDKSDASLAEDPKSSSSNLQRSMASSASLNASNSTPNAPANNLSGLVCNVHRITGKSPPPLVGASTTISGDFLYVFGGRRLSRRNTHLVQDLYQLDLIRRHWQKLETTGPRPSPRYFHSVCALGDTKLVCYGGMAPNPSPRDVSESPKKDDNQSTEPSIVVMSDVHIYDIATKLWTYITASNPPPGRYAHCATILPSYGVYTSSAALAAKSTDSNSSLANSNGRGGAEMIVVGGQDSASRYIEQISVFNLRSLCWTAVNGLGRSCGAYRSVIAPLVGMKTSEIGNLTSVHTLRSDDDDDSVDGGYATLVYSNYNFLDVKLELQIRLPNGVLSEKPMKGNFSPPGLRFPNGDVIDNHFIVSGTFLTTNKQEYALWALDLRTLTWSRIDAGPGILTSGSWNRGVLWKKKNTFVILGDRRRNLAEDYNHRRLNFSNICTVELEAFGLYDNPIQHNVSISADSSAWENRYQPLIPCSLPSIAAQNLGQAAANMKEATDMDFVALGGEVISVNSHLIARRWGPYFAHLIQQAYSGEDDGDAASTAPTLRARMASQYSRNSSITITPMSQRPLSTATTATTLTVTNNSTSGRSSSTAVELAANGSDTPEDLFIAPSSPSRVLYLPHTYLTIRALVHYLYTWSLPPANTTLCSPQILCSLLQIARPYQIAGLLEATVERLHTVLDARNTAAIFNAAAMAAGGSSIDDGGFTAETSRASRPISRANVLGRALPASMRARDRQGSATQSESEDELSTTSSASMSGADSQSDVEREEPEVWTGEMSAVVGLQKRGLRGLMEGRRLRERGDGKVESPAVAIASPNLGMADPGAGIGARLAE